MLAAPTYDGGVMPVMADFINHLKMKAYQKRKVAFIENGSWAPMAAKLMKEQMAAMKDIEIVDEHVTIRSRSSSRMWQRSKLWLENCYKR